MDDYRIAYSFISVNNGQNEFVQSYSHYNATQSLFKPELSLSLKWIRNQVSLDFAELYLT